MFRARIYHSRRVSKGHAQHPEHSEGVPHLLNGAINPHTFHLVSLLLQEVLAQGSHQTAPDETYLATDNPQS
jgi:hypothetical protein